MTARLIYALCAVAFGCGGASRSPGVTPALLSSGVRAPGNVAPSVAPSSALAPEPVSPSAAVLDWSVVRVLPVPVRAIALGDGTRIAVLADTPYVGDARGLHALPVPAALQAKPGDVDRVGIFFGRDNEPRIMGKRRRGNGESAIYWRHVASGWRDGREEIGQLGGPSQSGLWGVLGGADPELVCRTNAICIIKRVSGWTTAPAGAVERVVTLQDGALWGLDASGVASIDAHGWALALPAPTWSEPKALWATRDEAWVSTPRALFRYSEGKWQAQPSPVGEVAEWWGARADSIWVAGSEGAAHFDGHAFRRLSIAGPLRAVRGRSDGEVWFGGDGGLFRVAASG